MLGKSHVQQFSISTNCIKFPGYCVAVKHNFSYNYKLQLQCLLYSIGALSVTMPMLSIKDLAVAISK